MTYIVTIETDSGLRTYTGHVVCRGPSTMEMLLTDPFPVAGRTVQFPLTAIVSQVDASTVATGVAAS